MEEATVNFTMEVKDSAADKLSETSEGSMESSLSVWGFSSTISGKVTTSRENHALERQDGEVRHLRPCRPTARRRRHGEAQQYLCLGYRADNELGQFYNLMKKDAPLGASFSFRP